jgi:hypothetical protein
VLIREKNRCQKISCYSPFNCNNISQIRSTQISPSSPSMYESAAAYPRCMFMLHVRTSCPCCMSVLDRIEDRERGRGRDGGRESLRKNRGIGTGRNGG